MFSVIKLKLELYFISIYISISKNISISLNLLKSCKIEKSFSRYETLRTHFTRKHLQVNVQVLLQETSIENNDINLTNTTNIQNIIEEIVAEQLPCDNGNIENICLKAINFFVFKIEIKTFPI